MVALDAIERSIGEALAHSERCQRVCAYILYRTRTGRRCSCHLGSRITASKAIVGYRSGSKQRAQLFVPAVAKDQPRWAIVDGQSEQPRADVIASRMSAADWQWLSPGNGAQRARLHAWNRLRSARLQLNTEERRWEHWLLAGRSVTDPTDLAHHAGTAGIVI